jgi:hypothetical protein
MSKKKLSAGDIIESGCTRCRTVMNHTIVAMVGEKVVRVQCNTCNGIHNYKPAAEQKTSAKSVSPRKPAAPRKSRKDPGAADREEWESLFPTMKSEQAIAYEMTGKFKLKDLVKHPVFGLGVVKSVVPNKIEVLFREGKKLLRCQ